MTSVKTGSGATREARSPHVPRVASASPNTAIEDSERRHAILWRLTCLAAFLIAWQVLVFFGVLDSRFVSSPIGIVLSAPNLLTSPKVLDAIGVTLLAVVLGFVIGAIAGLVVGLVLGLQRLLRDAFFPIITLLLGTPKAVFLPLLMLVFGLGPEVGIAFASVLAFVHVTVNVVAGLDMVERKYYNVADAFSASKWRLFIDVILPAATPGIFAGLYHGIRNSFTGVVIAQLFISSVGVGYLVRLYTNNFQTDDAMALILIMALLVIVAGSLWGSLETKLTKWRK